MKSNFNCSPAFKTKIKKLECCDKNSFLSPIVITGKNEKSNKLPADLKLIDEQIYIYYIYINIYFKIYKYRYIHK